MEEPEGFPYHNGADSQRRESCRMLKGAELILYEQRRFVYSEL